MIAAARALGLHGGVHCGVCVLRPMYKVKKPIR